MNGNVLSSVSEKKNEKGEDYWHIYFAKPTKNVSQTAKYLGRYLKKPPVSVCRLAHYDGDSRITLRFLNHRTNHHENLELPQRELILRLNQAYPGEILSDDPVLWLSPEPSGGDFTVES